MPQIEKTNHLIFPPKQSKDNPNKQYTMPAKVDATPVSDPTRFLLDNPYAEFVLMHTNEIKYLCMLGYTFLHGSKLFATFSGKEQLSFKFVNMIMKCTGGGILVPIFINAVPVPLSQDAYPIAIAASFILHQYFPFLRYYLAKSAFFKMVCIFLFETMRAMVVVKLTTAAGAAIPVSDLSFPLFGPIFCGTIAGCGGAFLPFNKGLDPIKETGLQPPMLSAMIAATILHLFMNSSLSDGIINAKQKCHIVITTGFILYGFYTGGVFSSLFRSSPPKKTVPAPVAKKGKNEKKND